MSHEHEFTTLEEEGFEGLGRNEQKDANFTPASLVYYQLATCYCGAEEYRSWLFDTDDFELCCENAHADEPAANTEHKITDFIAPERQITAEFKCKSCGTSQTVESSMVRSTIV